MAETGHTVLFPPGGLLQSDPSITVECSSAEVMPEDVLPKSSKETSFSSKDLKDGSFNDQHQNKHSCSLTAHREHVLSPHKVLNEHSLLSVQRSHSDSLQIFKQSTASPLYCETGDTFCQGRDQDVCAQSFPSLVCKQAMPLQQSNTVTTSTRAGGSGSGSPTQPANHGFIQVCEIIPESTCPKFEEADCCNSHYHHGAVDDTFAAYCHPQPIPAPAQLLPHLVGMEENYKGQVSANNLLALPRLISSVSETGLDGKRLLRCCNLDCSWPGPWCPVGAQRWMDQKTTREAETMTSQNELRNVGVQVGQDSEEHPQHVFPEVCLVEEKTNVKTVSKSQKSHVKEVKWDAEGMTWEVYGASADPEELGLAIQRHLEIQIKETKGIAAKLSRQNTTTTQLSSGSTQRRKKGLLGSLRRPGCCSRTTGAVD
ncbi:GRIN2-like protein isoform X2 [Pimephales promelas]|nr:GRIN2-like protein isoform X2 [Pimephales promelas]XP_039528953.1 GRIN2-like protein isoform X2 [Pimephales promelas]KAG1927117.1 G protein-regulated inducer of neurite outgrowth [Pimephales promelas]